MVKLVNRAKMTTATTGTGTITVGSAVEGFQTFVAAGVSNGEVVRYTIEEDANWEVGSGTYNAGTLTRSVDESSNSGAAINLSGTAEVYVTAASADIQQPPSEGAFVDGDKTKLDGIETGATGDQTASEILTAIKTVDGAGSGLDADLLDGQSGAYYLDYNNFSNTPTLYNDSAVDTHLNTGTAASGELLSWNGADYDWIALSGGSREYTASEDITAGLAVVLDTNGEVSLVGNTAGDPSVDYSTTAISNNAGPAQLSVSLSDEFYTRFQIVYSDGSDGGKCKIVGGVVTKATQSIAMGTPVVLSTNFTVDVAIASQGYNACVVFGGAVDGTKVANVRISGSTLTSYGPTQLSTFSPASIAVDYLAYQNQYAVAYNYYDSNYKLAVHHVSFANLGAPVDNSSTTISSDVANGDVKLARFDYNSQGYFTLKYVDEPFLAFNVGVICIGQATSSSVSLGTATTNADLYQSTLVNSVGHTSNFDSVAYVIGQNNNQLAVYSSEVDLATKSFVSGLSSNTNITSVNALPIAVKHYGYSDDKAMVLYKDTTFGSETFYIQRLDLTPSGSAPYFSLSGSPTEIDDNATNPSRTTHYDLAVNFQGENFGVIVPYGGGYSDEIRYYEVTPEPLVSNYESWIGLAESTVTSGNPVPVTVIGGYNDNLSGLTIGTDYYLAEDGSFTTTSTNVKVGKAVAADEILVTEGPLA